MKSSNSLWKAKLDGKMPEDLAREIDIFETEITLRKQGKLEERLFAETRLRRGAYGQRYDNGQRNDGQKIQKLNFPSGDLTKGPNTMWDAPGMQRIKIPAGGLNGSQLETMAELAEEYSDGIAHVTTRQDFQLHYIHIAGSPPRTSPPARLAEIPCATLLPAPTLGFAPTKVLTSRLMRGRYRVFYSDIPIARVSAASSSLHSADARSMPAA
jgi:sulfite reductase beta subunit-like hemoprotein